MNLCLKATLRKDILKPLFLLIMNTIYYKEKRKVIQALCQGNSSNQLNPTIPNMVAPWLTDCYKPFDFSIIIWLTI